VNWLFENALPIWVGGTVLVILALVICAQLRTLKSLLAVVAVVLCVVGLLLVEAIVVTPREAVKQTLDQVFAAVEANDLPAVLRLVSPQAAQVRADAQTLMPSLKIEKANSAGTIKIDIVGSANPAVAVARFRAILSVTHKKTGMKGGYFDKLVVHFVWEKDRWLVQDFSATKDWRKKIGKSHSAF